MTRRAHIWLPLALLGAIPLAAGSAAAQPGEPYPPPPSPDDPYGSPDAPPGPAEPAPPPDAPAPPPAPGPYAQPPPAGQPPYGQPPYAQPPPPPGIQRQGWFIGFSLAAGSISLRDDNIESDSYGGVQFGLRFGGMLSPKFGLMLDLGGGMYTVDEASQTALAVSAFSIAAQYWAISQLWLRAGIGSGRLGTRREGNRVGDDLEGVILSGAIGYEVWQGRRFALDLALQASTGRFDPDRQDVGMSQAGLAIGFNWY